MSGFSSSVSIAALKPVFPQSAILQTAKPVFSACVFKCLLQLPWKGKNFRKKILVQDPFVIDAVLLLMRLRVVVTNLIFVQKERICLWDPRGDATRTAYGRRKTLKSIQEIGAIWSAWKSLRVCRVGDCSSGDGTVSAIDSSGGLV